MAKVIGESSSSFKPGDYKDTSALRAYLKDPPPADGMYVRVDPADVKPGDLVLFSGHVGIVTKPINGKEPGKFIGSQGDPDKPRDGDGVGDAVLGPDSYWGKTREVKGYLRYTGKSSAAGKSNTKGADTKSKTGAGKGDASKAKDSAEKPKAPEVRNEDLVIARKKVDLVARTNGATDAHWPAFKGVVQAYENYQSLSKLYAGSVMTFIKKQMIWLYGPGRVGPTDPVHDDHKPGTNTGTYRGAVVAASCSPNCKVEGQAVVRDTDKTQQNLGNTKGIVAPKPAKATAGKGKRLTLAEAARTIKKSMDKFNKWADKRLAEMKKQREELDQKIADAKTPAKKAQLEKEAGRLDSRIAAVQSTQGLSADRLLSSAIYESGLNPTAIAGNGSNTDAGATNSTASASGLLQVNRTTSGDMGRVVDLFRYTGDPSSTSGLEPLLQSSDGVGSSVTANRSDPQTSSDTMLLNILDKTRAGAANNPGASPGDLLNTGIRNAGDGTDGYVGHVDGGAAAIREAAGCAPTGCTPEQVVAWAESHGDNDAEAYAAIRGGITGKKPKKAGG